MNNIPNRRRSPYYSEAHEVFRASIRRFVEREIEPHVTAWFTCPLHIDFQMIL